MHHVEEYDVPPYLRRELYVAGPKAIESELSWRLNRATTLAGIARQYPFICKPDPYMPWSIEIDLWHGPPRFDLV